MIGPVKWKSPDKYWVETMLCARRARALTRSRPPWPRSFLVKTSSSHPRTPGAKFVLVPPSHVGPNESRRREMSDRITRVDQRLLSSSSKLGNASRLGKPNTSSQSLLKIAKTRIWIVSGTIFRGSHFQTYSSLKVGTFVGIRVFLIRAHSFRSSARDHVGILSSN